MKIVLIVSVVFVVLVIVAFVAMGFQSRNGVAPGMSEMRLSPCGSAPNCVSSGAPPDSEQYIAGIAVGAGGEDAAWSALVAAIAEAGGRLEQNSPPYLAATFTSKVFGFVDDFEAMIDRNAGLIHLRSSARVGYSDMNVNRARLERIRGMLDEP